MATTEHTKELNIELLTADSQGRKVLKMENPKSTLTREQVISALAPALTLKDGTAQSANPVYFFVDDTGSYNEPLTQVGEIQIVEITKVVTDIV